MESFIEIKESLKPSTKLPKKKDVKMKDVFSNSKTPNKVIAKIIA